MVIPEALQLGVPALQEHVNLLVGPNILLMTRTNSEGWLVMRQ
jgi:hypothetical protein